MSTVSIPFHAADSAAESERNAYNAAFYALGLRWHWDSDTFAALQAFADPCDRIRRYLETQHPHLLRAYDPEFLANAIESRKTDCRTTASGYFNWAEARAAELGI